MKAWTAFVTPISERFRLKRAEQILREFPDFNRTDVVDLGGSAHFWEKVQGILKPRKLRILNISDDTQTMSMRDTEPKLQFKIEIYDGRHIPFKDASIELLLCNSVIEHVPPSQRNELALEVRRVSRSFIVQTPAFIFPFEPHFVMPFLHWLPRWLGRRYAMISVWRMLSWASQEQCERYFDEVHLLRRIELENLFPEAKIIVETFYGIPKSYLAVFRSLN